MIKTSLVELAKALNGKLVGVNHECQQTADYRVVTDSRADCLNAVFVALRGPHFDAHDFLPQVVSNGASCLVVEKESALAIPQIIVENCKLALGDIARLQRKKLAAKFIAITGSSGKTTVKEMIFSILQLAGKSHATKGNFNNDIGVPLTLLDMASEDQYAVIELGANHAGEIAYSAAITQPDVALVNNVAAAHLQGFGDLHGVARAKGEIFLELKPDGIAVINNDDDFADFWKKRIKSQMLTFSSKAKADVVANNIQLDKNQCPAFELEHANEKIFIRLPLAGLHNVNNALAAAACCLALKIPMQLIASGLTQVPVVKGRLVTENLANGCRLIDDTYNANLDSMRAAIDLLAKYQGRKVLVIGDMAELGDFGRQCHEQVGLMARDAKIDALYSCGVLSQFSFSQFSCSELNRSNSLALETSSESLSGIKLENEINLSGQHFSNQQNLIKKIIKEANMGTTILVKGSRSAHMENVIMALKAFLPEQSSTATKDNQIKSSEEC